MINKRRGKVITAEFLINMLKTFVCGAISCVAAHLIYRFISGVLGDGAVVTFVKLCIAALPALIIYIVLGFFFKINEFKQILGFFKRN